MSQQQIIVRPLGLITQPNKIGGFPDGAMSDAMSVYMRDPNIIEQAARTNVAFGTVPNTSGVSGGLVFLLPGPPGSPVAGSTQVLVIYKDGSTWRYALCDGTNIFNNALPFNDLYGVNQLFSENGRFSSVVARNRQIVNFTKAVMVIDQLTTTPTPRNAGMLPVHWFANYVAGAGGAYTGTAHYTCVIRRVFSDGYEMVSAPAMAMWIPATASFYSGFGVYLSPAWHRAGDIIDLYRTRSQPNATNTGADYFLATSYTITAADISATVANIVDRSNDDALGEALYTNPGQQGEQAAAYPPPQCKAIANFKGHTFYLNCTDPPLQKLRVPSYFGFMGLSASGANAYARASGIGSRVVSGTTTNGNPTMTGVSAGDMVGIQVNQYINDSRFPSGTKVVSFTASTITFDANANASGVYSSLSISDVLEVDGGVVPIQGTNNFAAGPRLVFSTANGQWVLQGLDRVYPEASGWGISQVETTFAEGFTVGRWFLADGHSSSLTLRATNGQNFVPQLPLLATGVAVKTVTETARPNGVSWSEQNQPERVPPANVLPVGLGEIYAAFSTRDALWIFASDGLWRLSGTGGSVGDGYDWRVDPVDSTLSISGPQAGCVLRDTVFAYTNRGFVAIDSAGNIRELSMGRINDLLPGPPWALPTWSATKSMWMFADETHDEIYFTVGVQSTERVYVYNTLTDAFTYLVVETLLTNRTPTHGAYVRTSEENIFAQVASSPSVIGRSGGNYAPFAFNFQPVGGDNPFVMRHWQTANFILQQAGAAQPVTPVINGTAFASTVTPTLMGDSGQQRVSVGVPRNSPAIANQIAVGLQNTSTASTGRRFLALALDYVDMTDQRRKR